MDYQNRNYNPHSFDSKVAQTLLMGIAAFSLSVFMLYMQAIVGDNDSHRRNVLQWTGNFRELIR